MPGTVFKGSAITQDANASGRIVRVVGEDGLLLYPNEQPLVTFLMEVSKRKPMKQKTPVIEFYENDYEPGWVQADAAGYTSGVTTINVAAGHGARIIPNTVIVVPNAAGVSTKPELMLVTAIATDALTVVRGFAGSTAAAVAANAAISLLGTAFIEFDVMAEAKGMTPALATQYMRIFKRAVKVSRTQANTSLYGAPGGERARLHAESIANMKIEMNKAFLFSRTHAGSATVPRETAGLNTVISTNVTDAGGNITRTTFESFARQVFDVGSETKLLLACPMLVSAIHEWGNSHLQLEVGAKAFGVQVTKVHTGHGTLIVMKDRQLTDGISGGNGFSGWNFAIDPNELSLIKLEGQGDLSIEEDVKKDGSDGFYDQIRTECGLKIKHERKHGKLYNVTGFVA